MKLELNDHIVVVVGGASGIGLAAAEVFASEGAAVQRREGCQHQLRPMHGEGFGFAWHPGQTVCPGMVQTPLARSVWQAWHDQASADQRLSFQEWSDRKIRAIVPLGRWQTAAAVADMIVFLSSARGEHVTGQTINVDGGIVMHS